MYARILFYLLFSILLPHFSCGQAATAAELEAAQARLEKVEKEHGSESIEYAYAAFDLGLLYYKNPAAREEADSLAFPAVRFVRTTEGHYSSEYRELLKQLPNQLAVLLDAELDAQDALAKSGAESLPYAEKLLKVTQAYRPFNNSKGHFYCLRAFRILAASKYNRALYDYGLCSNQIG